MFATRNWDYKRSKKVFSWSLSSQEVDLGRFKDLLQLRTLTIDYLYLYCYLFTLIIDQTISAFSPVWNQNLLLTCFIGFKTIHRVETNIGEGCTFWTEQKRESFEPCFKQWKICNIASLKKSVSESS